MRLEKLELQGFKSFAKKTEILFSDGVTAVIGPNGSGKSNISDAIRWVLGEQSARALRGNKMEDIIFNGTAAKRPLSMCSVSLTFDNKDHRLPTDYTEVEITRRVYRSGEGEYSINGRTCRLKDILDLFRDTGIGKDGYSIISQGRVDEILSNRSRDRREALEEAAGVMRYRIRREEAVRKLEQTAKNLERIGDIERELSARLGPLERESRKAQQAAGFQEELKTLEVNLFLRETDRSRERLQAQREVLASYETSLEENRTADAELLERTRLAEAELARLEELTGIARAGEMDALSKFEAGQGEIRLIEERLRAAEAETERAAVSAEEEKQTAERLETALGSSPELLHEHIESLRAALEEKESLFADATAEAEQAEKALEDMKNAMMESMNRLAEARSGQSRLEATGEALKKRGEEILAQTAAKREKLAALEEEYEEAKQTLTSMTEQFVALNNELLSLEADGKQAQQAYNELLSDIRRAGQEEAGLFSRLNVLRELSRKREGYQNSVRLLMNDVPKNDRLKRAVTGVVAEMISVPEKLETAIGTVLGGALQNIIAPSGDDGKAIIEYVREKQYGRVTVLPLDLLHIQGDDPRTERALRSPGVLGLADRLITYEPEAEKAVRYLLGRTLVVEDMDSALRVRRNEKCTLQMVTLQGDLLQSGGAMSGGSRGKQSFGLISREREIQELEAAAEGKRKARNALEAKLETLERSIKASETAVQEKRTALSWQRTDTERQKDKLSIIERDRSDCLEAIDSLEEERETNRESLAELENRMRRLGEERAALENSETVTREDILASQRTVTEKRAARDVAMNAVSDARLKVTVAEKDELMRTRERERLKTELVSAGERRAAALRQTDALRLQKETLLAEKETALALAVETDARLKNAREEKEALEESLRAGKEELSSLRSEREELLSENRDLLDKKTKAEMALGKIQTQTEQLADRIWQSYALTYENALAFKKELPLGDSRTRAVELRQLLRELGSVNPGSIEEYAEVSARHTEMKVQLDDLTAASEDLNRLIQKLTGTMEKVFSEGLQKVQEQFSTVFRELFGGGNAELKLQDPSDALNCDIDIIAQPPGKKLQLLSLMSGGERALTAIALLFAMLRIKSPAFCVLDEIESSLDEENVTRFASFLKVYGAETQFIMITHRKGSMEAADSLYGVAMEEKGISSIVSAKWEEAI